MKVLLKRRLKYKTDYRRRLKLLKSEKPRLVIRKTNKYIIVQIVKSDESKDFTIAYTNSKELSKFGWNYGFKNLPAAYLTGYLAAKKVLKRNVKEVVVDIGLQSSTKGSRIYAAVKGAIDGGLSLNCSKEMFDESRFKGEHLKNKFKDINKKIEEIKQKIKF
ncbi:MAG: 50S ribosomal protein L18 [Candidatus Pacearchaeota archaeon]|nr:50S ribosomal protein L18 [Candidatus Pacearchaeota archaeon]